MKREKTHLLRNQRFELVNALLNSGSIFITYDVEYTRQPDNGYRIDHLDVTGIHADAERRHSVVEMVHVKGLIEEVEAAARNNADWVISRRDNEMNERRLSDAYIFHLDQFSHIQRWAHTCEDLTQVESCLRFSESIRQNLESNPNIRLKTWEWEDLNYKFRRLCHNLEERVNPAI